MDPLTVLREFVIANDLESVVEVGDRFQFGDRYSFPKVRSSYVSGGAAMCAVLTVCCAVRGHCC